MQFIEGDATEPFGEGPKIIVHICNDVGKWGKGFVMALSRKWPETREHYLDWYQSKKDFVQGAVQFIQVEPKILVANMIAQEGIKGRGSIPPIRYGKLFQCLNFVGDRALEDKATVHMPRIGCGLAGGKWEHVEQIVRATLEKSGVEVFVYNLPSGKEM